MVYQYTNGILFAQLIKTKINALTRTVFLRQGRSQTGFIACNFSVDSSTIMWPFIIEDQILLFQILFTVSVVSVSGVLYSYRATPSDIKHQIKMKIILTWEVILITNIPIFTISALNTIFINLLNIFISVF